MTTSTDTQSFADRLTSRRGAWITLGQLGLIVGVGVIVDTLVVRAVIVPSIFTLMGDRIWRPSKASNASAC